MTEPQREDQIATDADLPSKERRDDCCFGYVREVLMCTNNITLYPEDSRISTLF
jgi:hypothetical protein